MILERFMTFLAIALTKCSDFNDFPVALESPRKGLAKLLECIYMEEKGSFTA